MASEPKRCRVCLIPAGESVLYRCKHCGVVPLCDECLILHVANEHEPLLREHGEPITAEEDNE